MGKTFNTGTLVNGLSVDASGNVTLPAIIYIGSSTSSRIETASNIIRGFFSTESTPRFAIGRDVFANGQAGISLGAGTSYAGIGVNTTGNGGGNLLYFSLNNQLSTGLDSSVYGTMTTSGFSYTTPSSTGNILNISTNASWTSGFMNHTSFTVPNITGGAVSIGFGKNNAGYNLAKLAFTYVGNGSTLNYIGLGFWDADNRLVVRGDGNVGIGTTTPYVRFDVLASSGSTDVAYFKTNDFVPASTGSRFGIGFAASSGNTASLLTATSNGQNEWNDMQFKALNHIFYTNNGERLRITSDGRVGIGITPAASIKLDILGNVALNDQQLRTRGGADPNHALVHTSAIDGPFLYGYQGAALGYSSSGNYLRVIWTSTTNAYNYNNSTTWQQTSDIKVKENIRPITGGLDKIISLNPSHFEYKNKPGQTKTGFIAQEFEQVFPGHVSEVKPMDDYKEYFEEDEMMKTIDPDLIPYLVQAIKELKAEIDILKNK